MGYLTTFTIYNDGCSLILENSKDFAKKIYNGCLGVYHRPSEPLKRGVGLGNHANLITIQKPRHADDHTTYVHMGNTVIEMNPHSDATIRLAESRPEFFDAMLRHLERTVKDLKKLKNAKQDLDKSI